MDYSPRRDARNEDFCNYRKSSRCLTPTPPKFNRCQLVMGDRLLAALTMALPFVVCFTTFGVFNLIAGSVLTSMAWKPRNMTRALLDSPFPREEAVRWREKFVDPLKVMGPILLITGVMLVVVGFVLGLTACRSVYASRDSLKLPLPALQLSGFNGHGNFGASWMAVPPRKNSVVLAGNDKITRTPVTTKVTIESPTPPSLKEAEISPTETFNGRNASGNNVRNKRKELTFAEETPSCSYFDYSSVNYADSLRLTREGVSIAPNLTGGCGDLWSGETSCLVTPYELDSETYIT